MFLGCDRAASNYSWPHMGNTFGQLFRVTTFGESHGGGIGVVVDGCPPRIAVSDADIQQELDRRRPGQSKITTQRKEPDRCEILSGVFEGRTLGTPITVLVRNQDARPEAYEAMRETFRPSHADFTYQAKYGIRNWQGGGRASARETIGRVAGGAIARKVLTTLFPKIEVIAFVTQIHQIVAEIDRSKVKIADVEASIVRCPDKAVAKNMIDLIEKTRANGDSLGGMIECVARNVPPGLGEPVFDKLEADLAKAMLSLPATKGFEIGSGLSATRMFGSEHNVRVHSDREPEPLFRFRFDGLTEPNLEHVFGFGFEHCSECSEPDRGQSRWLYG